MPLARLERDPDVSAVRGVLHGVVDEVRENLAQLALVGGDGRDLVRTIGEVEPRSLRQMRPRRGDDGLDELPRLAALDSHVERAGVELAREQEVVDDLGEAR